MGGGNSAPRSVTLEQESSGVVKVSEAVARRLVGKPETNEPIKKTQMTTISAEDRSEELNKLQTRYEKRIRALEKQNKDLHQTTTEQFAKAVEEVEKKFLKTTAAPICDDLQAEVMKCYQDNPKESLHCSQLVKSYSTCVQQQRESILTKKDCQPCMLAQMARGPCGPQFMKAYDCYLEDGSQEECGLLYLEMKECWDKHSDYGYQKIMDKAYDDTPSATKDKSPPSKASNKTDEGSSKIAEVPQSTSPANKDTEAKKQK